MEGHHLLNFLFYFSLLSFPRSGHFYHYVRSPPAPLHPFFTVRTLVPVTLCHRCGPAAPMRRSGWTCREAVCRRRGRRRRHGLAAATEGTVAPTCVTSLYAAAAASSSTDWRRLPTATGLTAHSCSTRNSQAVRLRCTVHQNCGLFCYTFYLSSFSICHD